MYPITPADVTDGFTTSATTADVLGYIALMDQANTCLTANKISITLGRQMKILGVRHLCTNSTERGAVTQERAVSGASRTYAERPGGQTSYLATLRSIDRHGCIMALLSQGGSVRLMSAGRRPS
jgi:3-dehydroquinate synthase class II